MLTRRTRRPFSPRFVGPFWWQLLLVLIVLLVLLIALPFVMNPEPLP